MRIDEIGEIIKKRRDALNIDQKTLSEISEVSVHTITDIESGKANPSVIVLNKLLSSIGLELSIRVKGIDNE
ncbi:MAG: helix-turn-helix domain-containing protein [Spirochaetes bacterium]|nr:helix-turn-helix domain-containing protein [Spirochaetota bacterium]